ncbi:hydrogenase maturation nickel metallochaperone HypA [Nocardioides sp. GY 10127]|uniref:hydrogenase maturation nickel metallochaperone HypA n=1 Tax=Nocardioides sp. GY 10127 TaxID=2569762 RepID=UPI0010A7FA59|nr:hydrogenase maturation nickel metallochaperone HypA [Nocardioides sp. GY 10127]TIC82616.1 hydrogenase maturation nickel metallochaperone HypA [Nocardioides sp. GY 10127]
MHELSLCRSIAQIADRARQGRPVAAVHLRVGQLRQVVPETLVYCWGLVTDDGPLAGSRLEVESVPVVLDCRACGETTRVAHVLVLTCAACGSGDIELRTGEEFLVTSLDLGPPADEPAPTPTPTLREQEA